MSIRTYFENIADAIKDKNPNVTNVTPAEMPSAIRSIPSGSSTAIGVSYDNTSSGLTASNVQDAIDELAGDVSTIYSDLSALKEYVEFPLVANTTTYGQMISGLYALIDVSKITSKSVIYINTASDGGFVYKSSCMRPNNSNGFEVLMFTCLWNGNTILQTTTISLTDGKCNRINVRTNGTTEGFDITNQAISSANGNARLYY